MAEIGSQRERRQVLLPRSSAVEGLSSIPQGTPRSGRRQRRCRRTPPHEVTDGRALGLCSNTGSGVRATRATIPSKLQGARAPKATTPRKLRWFRSPRTSWASWSAQAVQVLQNERFSQDIPRISARRMRHPRAGTHKVNIFTVFGVPVGAQGIVFDRGFCEKRAAPFFLQGKTGVCGPRYLSRIRDGGRTFLERARAIDFVPRRVGLYLVFYSKTIRRPVSRMAPGDRLPY